MIETVPKASRVAREASLEADGPINVDNWQDPPFNRWGFSHVAEMVTSAVVSRHPRAELTEERSGLPTSATVAEIVTDEFLEETHTEAFLVMRGQEVLHERYLGASRPTDRHLLMSVSKSLCALVVGRLVRSGSHRPERHRAELRVPISPPGAYGHATVQQVLDMTASVDYSEDYHNPAAHVHEQDRVAGWRPSRDGDPADTYEFLTTLQPAGEHGRRVPVLLRLHRRPGLDRGERDRPPLRRRARFGAVVAARLLRGRDDHRGPGRLRLRERRGRLHCPGPRPGRPPGADDGRVRGEQVVPAGVDRGHKSGGDRAAADGTAFQRIHPRGSYRNQWWSTGDDRGTCYATGIHGQFLWLDPTSDVTIVKFSSLPLAVTEETSRRHAEAFNALTRALA